MTEAAKTNQQARPDRSKKTRTPLGKRNVLSFDHIEEGYSYRVINDKNGRIQAAIKGGYEFVTTDGKLGDERVAEGTIPGSAICKPVGDGMNGYLMRIRKEWYDEDQAEKQKTVDRIEEALKPASQRSTHDFEHETYGKGVTNE